MLTLDSFYNPVFRGELSSETATSQRKLFWRNASAIYNVSYGTWDFKANLFVWT
jgi:hypothetical protein